MAGELQCDVLVAGGGINGAAIARDAAGRGLSVILCEQDDLAAHTSSASTKLIHGGLRYLEHGEVGLVRKALQERQVLLRAAPHLVRPLRLVLVHDDSMRPAWVLQSGLWLYDLLAGRSDLPASRRIDLAGHPAGEALRPAFRTGFEFSDAWTDDARLVATVAIDAAERGARIFTRMRLTRAQRDGPTWIAQAARPDGGQLLVRARALVNATGPWAGRFLQHVCGAGSARRLRLIKGSHVVVRRRLGHPFAYMLQSADRRIAFAIPFEDDFMLIGTTDVEVHEEPDTARIDGAEIDYLCDLANHYLKQPIGRGDIAWTFSGVRPLLDDGAGPSELTRDYALELAAHDAPLLTVWGGKITTFRTLAEEAIDRLGTSLGGTRGGWTRDARLPGGDLPSEAPGAKQGQSALEAFVAALSEQYGWMPPQVIIRMARAYGSRVHAVLGSACRLQDLGEPIAAGLFEAELEYLIAREWAGSADDVLWRRSKLGLHLSLEERQRVTAWFERRLGPPLTQRQS
ncbi:MAG TPA: glycerol-3-phosphate dehydrogenase [Burkholderiaceae bacterium]|nr:glycerol-3-phosphate dehydrogenase [Burkholderiaceae bacterium]